MDTSLFFLINQGLQNVVFDFTMPFITKNTDILFTLVAIPFLLKDWRKALLVLTLLAVGLAVGDSSGNILKHLIERIRPCKGSLEGVRILIGCGCTFSLPSNHAVNAFVMATIFSHFFRKAALPMFFIAFLVGFSRIYVGVHYPFDVIAGAVWGGFIAGTVLFLHKWSSKRFKERPYETIMLISLLLLCYLRYYYLAIYPIGLSPDETHYWEWSRRLDLSYYSKGPAIAYLIASTTWLMGDTVFGIRFLAPLFLAFSSLFVYMFTMELFNDSKKACAAALLIQITPLFAVYGILMTIDSPLIFFWTLSLYLFWKAVEKQRSGVGGQESGSKKLTADNCQLYYWFLLGITIGLGLLTKYTMAFFYLCAFLFIASSREQRFWLKRKEPYLALLISLIIFSPVIIWNANHDWVTVRHTAGQAHLSDGLKISMKYFFNFLGSQLGVITPILFFLVIYGAIRSYILRPSSLVPRYLFWFWMPILGIYILKSLQGKVQGNWAMPAYVTAFIASADFFLGKDVFRIGAKILLVVALAIAIFVSSVAHFPRTLNLPPKMDPSSRLRGWEELGIKTGEIYAEMISSGNRDVFIFSNKYQVSSELAFYMPQKPRTYFINPGSRMNQYDIWGGLDGLLGQDALFVKMGVGDFPEELKNVFDSYEKKIFIVYEKDRILRGYTIFKCYGFKGLKLRKIKSY